MILFEYCQIIINCKLTSYLAGGSSSGNVGAIAGGVVGGLLAIAIIVGVVVLILCIRKRKTEKESPYPGNQIQFHPSSVSELNYATGSGEANGRQTPQSFHDTGHVNYGLRNSDTDSGYRESQTENIYHDLDHMGIRDSRNPVYDAPTGKRLSEEYVMPTGNIADEHRPPSSHSVLSGQDIYLNPRKSHHDTNQINPNDRQYVM